MKEKIGRALLSFFVIMLCCTLVARGADSVNMAKVQTSAYKTGTLKHSFSGTGSLKTRERTFQFLPEGQKVSSLFRKPGASVEMGEPLVQLDQDYLADQIQDQRRAVEKLQLQIKQQRLNGQTPARLPATAQAELSLESAREARNKAREDLWAAQEAYQNFLDNPPKAPVPETDASGGGTTNQPQIPSPDTDTEGPSSPPQDPPSGSGSDEGGPSSPPQDPPSGSDTVNDDSVTQPPPEDTDIDGDETSPLPQNPPPGSDTVNDETTTQPPCPDTDTGASPQALAPFVVPHSVPRMATGALGDSDADQIEQKKQELQQQMDLAQSQLDAAQEAYDQAKKNYRLAEQEEANTQSNEAVQAQSSRLSVQGMQLDLEELQEELAKLEAIQNAGGLVMADTSGILESIGTSEGALTTGTEPIILASKELEACGLIPPEEIGRLSAGDQVDVLFSGSAKPIPLTVERLETDGQGSLFWYAPLDNNNALTGTPFSYDFNQVSSSTYEQVIPLSALYEGNGSTYVLVAELRSGILGESYTAVRVDVNLLEKDMQNAAIQTSLGRDAKIITQSNKYVKEGDRVRLNN